MHDSLFVGRREPEGDLPRELRRAAHRQRALGQRPPQGFALEQLHDGIGHAAGGSEIMDRQDVRMGQRGDRLRLPLQPGEGVGIGSEPLGQHLDRDVALSFASRAR